MQRKITFYRMADGQCPVENFLDILPLKSVQKVTWVLRLFVQLERIPAQYFCKMEATEDIWEFRIKQGPDIYRIFAFWDGNEIILTHGFIKKSQKTPRREIEKAQGYKNDYWWNKGVDNR